MLTLALAVGISVLTSFTCSLTEAALYAVPWSAIERARQSGRRAGKILYGLRSNIDKPIAAILTMNTVANTAGSAVAGAAFMAVFGGEHMGVFAAAFTCIILMMGEIVPKTLGVAYCTPIMMAFAVPLQWAVRLLSPLIWLLGLLTLPAAAQEDAVHRAAVLPDDSVQIPRRMGIHPDDPAWPIFGLPRIVTGKESILRILKAVDKPYNGITFCTGSLGSNPENDLLEIIRACRGRIPFAHIRNLKYNSPRDFEEAAHLSSDGSLDLYQIIKTLYETGFDGVIRPDHGRMIWGEKAMPGYGLYDRALGAVYLEGLWEAVHKERAEKERTEKEKTGMA